MLSHFIFLHYETDKAFGSFERTRDNFAKKYIKRYSLRSKLLVVEMDVSRTKIHLGTSISPTSISGRREYFFEDNAALCLHFFVCIEYNACPIWLVQRNTSIVWGKLARKLRLLLSKDRAMDYMIAFQNTTSDVVEHTASVGGSFELCIHNNPCICLLTITISSDGTAIMSHKTSPLMMARSIMLNELCNVEVDYILIV